VKKDTGSGAYHDYLTAHARRVAAAGTLRLLIMRAPIPGELDGGEAYRALLVDEVHGP
jgi:hypothetical protein